MLVPVTAVCAATNFIAPEAKLATVIYGVHYCFAHLAVQANHRTAHWLAIVYIRSGSLDHMSFAIKMAQAQLITYKDELTLISKKIKELKRRKKVLDDFTLTTNIDVFTDAKAQAKAKAKAKRKAKRKAERKAKAIAKAARKTF